MRKDFSGEYKITAKVGAEFDILLAYLGCQFHLLMNLSGNEIEEYTWA